MNERVFFSLQAGYQSQQPHVRKSLFPVWLRKLVNRMKPHCAIMCNSIGFKAVVVESVPIHRRIEHRLDLIVVVVML